MKIFALVLASAVCACAAPFELKDGDRVLLLGDALLERENSYGLLETRMHEQFPNVKFTVRNLSWSGETPKGWSRASFDGPEKGWERLKEQIAAVRPTVAILGFGMAASLQEMTDRSGDQTLNPDPIRYGAEPMSPARFKMELSELMDAINASTPDRQPARFVLLSPIKHQDLRSTRPDTPDPAPHNAILTQYSDAIRDLARERGTYFLPPFDFEGAGSGALDATHNGIDLTLAGYSLFTNSFRVQLWPSGAPKSSIPENIPPRMRHLAEDVHAKTKTKLFFVTLRSAIIKKNDLFFHQVRPANSTYLFGFRKHEQGKNAAEMPQFTPLIEAADAEIDQIKRGSGGAASKPADAASSPSGRTSGIQPGDPDLRVTLPVASPAAPQPDPKNVLRILPGARYQLGSLETADLEELRKALTELKGRGETRLLIQSDKLAPYKDVSAALEVVAKVSFENVALKTDGAAPTPQPSFSLSEGLEITLWADTNLVGKPVGMNWDANGRLWVACSPVYPQIKPGAHPDDKVVVLEDTDRDGIADKSTTFATDLLIAAGVAPDFGTLQKTPDGKLASPNITAAYVGSSTELVRVEDTNGDGVGDERRVVFSGFGTEDTHHTIHTLRWGPDGRLYFNQSIYIHSHMETPWGMVRLNSGGICAYDPRTEKVEVFARGFINTWGHAWDKWGQSFATDGAGFEGVHWIIPGAMYRTYEGARRILPSISPGSYPKYCGLEIIQSPLFPEDWQGNAITCDFRAHKLARFQINDLSQPTDGKEPLSGYITKELPNPVVTTDSSFRPIDVKLGPDGALYIADWTNPIINHGEVDFRDPRRDHVNGRIWRVAPKGKEPLKWKPLAGGTPKELLPLLDSGSEWAKTNALPELRRALETGDPRHAELLNAVEEWTRDWDRFRNSSSLLDLHRIQKVDEGSGRTMVALPVSNLPAVRAIAGRNLAWINIWDGSLNAKSRKPEYVEAPATLARDSNPRVRVEAMRGLAAWRDKEIVPLLLEAALNSPGGKAKEVRSEDKGTNQFNQPTFADTADPYYGYAAWLSVNDLAPQVMEWIEDVVSAKSGTAPAATDTEAKITYALQCLRPDQTNALLTRIISKRGLPRDGSGPWIELIGQAGGPAELRLLLNGLLANTVPDGDNNPPLADKQHAFTNPDANRRAAAALVAAAKRGAKPANPPYGGWHFHLYAPDEALNDVIRLAGLWKEDISPVLAAHIQRDAPKERLDAVFESLRNLATENAAKTLTAFLQPKLARQIDDQMLNFGLEHNSPAIRRRALATVASFRPDIATAALRGVLDESGSDVGIWRELFASERFNNALLKKMPELTKEQAASALRAARELGKRGEKLVAAFTPLAGESLAAPVPTDITQLVDNTKKNGNPVEGELIYRRAALTCTVCHAIGGAGGKVGPDLGTIGASAPLDYIIESTVNPAAKVKEGFHAVAVSLKDGRTLSGTVAKETDSLLTLRDMTGAEQSVETAGIKERTNIGSLMPPGLINTLNHREQANLFAFMAQLGKPGPFDASKASIARTWRVYPGDQIEQVVAGKPDASKGVAVHSLVDGRVTKDLMETPVAIAGENPTLAAVAKFALVSGGQHRLRLAGITKAWLNGAPLAIASDPNPVVELPAGEHTLVVKLDTKTLPDHFRAECPEARFLTE